MKNFFKIIRWLYPGLRIKRWIGLLLVGLMFIIIAAPHLTETRLLQRIIYTVCFAVGTVALISGTLYLIKSFAEVIYPHKDKDLIDIIYEKRLLARGPKVVAIGGGTGLSMLLEGLKEYTTNICAIVAVADEGGSSGRLREEFGILPPGDIRNCLVSLAEAHQLMRNLFQYRFTEGEGIRGHSFGNLFITAMTQVTGSFRDAVEESSKILAIRGKVIPSSLDSLRLRAEYQDGTTQEGEDKISDEIKPIRRVSLMPEAAAPNPEAIDAIREADLIVMGPGSLFTSIIPNLLIQQIREEIAKKDVIKLYVCNVMTQRGETDGFTAADHLEVLIAHSMTSIVNCCLVNSGRLDYRLLRKYAQDKSFSVIFDRERLQKMGVTVFEADVVSKVNYLHHDTANIAKEVMSIYNYFKKQ
ncbi:MAG: gluconeogenesis factor YvcK family protein [Candidatus Omnitrophota bacterium]|nr:YvcK family protein [Candidatus Omnitrophota bacterium]